VATTIYIPAELLEVIDRRARALKVSRNRYILEALRQRVAEPGDEGGWPRGFLEHFRSNAADSEIRRASDELEESLLSKRFSRRKPPRL